MANLDKKVARSGIQDVRVPKKIKMNDETKTLLKKETQQSQPMPLGDKVAQMSQMQSFRKPAKLPTVAANDDPSLVASVDEQVEQTTDQTEILKSIDSKIGVQTELSARTDQTNESLIVAVDKLNGLSDKLNKKYEAANDQKFEVEKTTSDAIKDAVEPSKTSDGKTPEELLFPEKSQPKPSTKLLDDGEQKKSGKELESTKKSPVGMLIGKATDVMKSGFKSSVGAIDKVFSFLFKMSIARAASAAKIALVVFSIIAAIDVIRAYWAVWGDELMAKLDEWATILSGWWESFKTFIGEFDFMFSVFETMSANFAEIRDAWLSGDFPALASAIGGAIKDLALSFEATLTRAVTKIISSIMRLIPGLGGAADRVEAFGLEHYQNATDGRLSKKDQLKLAKSQVEREKKDGKTSTERGWTDFLPNSFRNKVGILSDEEMKQIDSEKKDQDARKNMSDDDKIKNTAATNEAREALERYKKQADAANSDNASDMARVNKYKKEAQDYINNKDVGLSPSTKTELQNQFNAIKVKKPKVSPAPTSESNDVKTAQAIKSNEAKAKAEKAAINNTTNVQQNVSKINKSVNVQSPITSTNAPGVHRATGVN